MSNLSKLFFVMFLGLGFNVVQAALCKTLKEVFDKCWTTEGPTPSTNGYCSDKASFAGDPDWENIDATSCNCDNC